MASSVTFGGLTSGLDTGAIITALTQAETSKKTNLQNRQTQLKNKQAAYAVLTSSLSSLTRAANQLNATSAFSTFKATSNDEDVATLSTTSSSVPSTYELEVTKLAKSNKVASAAQADISTALGKAGTVTVNGKAMKIESGDSLRNIASKMNGLSAGVTASVIDGGAGKAYLSITASNSGAASSVSLSDLSGSAFSELGLIGSGSTVRQAENNTAKSFAFASKSSTLNAMMGATAGATSTINVGGTTIDIDPTADTLDTVASKINAAGITGVTASVQADTEAGNTVYRLNIAGTSSTPAISEAGGVLKALGVLRATPANELVAGQDAAYKLDGVSLTSATNTVASVIGGSTLTLKKEGTSTLSVTNDTSAVVEKVKTFVSAINTVIDTVDQQSTLDTATFQTGLLFGDSVARQVKEGVRSMLFTDTPGLTGTVKNLASLGLSIDDNGQVEMDEDVFNKALASDPDGIAKLFVATGSGSTTDVKYVSAGTSAKASTSTGYAVNISQLATKSSYVAALAQTGARTVAETLTFKGTGFGSNGISVDFEVGTDLAGTISKINSDGRLKELVTASDEGGLLKLTAKRWGTSGDFTVASNFSGSSTNSGIGFGTGGTKVTGVDTAGTINGETANGSGQFLVGSVGNQNTEGLQIQYTGTTTGNVGNLTYSRGVASRMQDLVKTFTTATTGLITGADAALQKQIEGLDEEMAKSDARLENQKTQLTKRYAAMEEAISKLQSQLSTFNSMMGTDSSS